MLAHFTLKPKSTASNWTTEVLTVTAQVAVLPPSLVVTVIVAVPAFTPVTTPSEETVATPVLDEVQATVLSVAVDGLTVAVRVAVLPCDRVRVVGETVTPVTGTVVVGFMSTVRVAILPGSRFFPDGTVISRVSVPALPVTLIVSFFPETLAGIQANQIPDRPVGLTVIELEEPLEAALSVGVVPE